MASNEGLSNSDMGEDVHCEQMLFDFASFRTPQPTENWKAADLRALTNHDRGKSRSASSRKTLIDLI